MKETAETFGNFKCRTGFVVIRHARLVQYNTVNVFGVNTDVFYNLLAQLGLQRHKTKNVLIVVFDHELHERVAKVANPVKQDDFFVSR